VAVLFDHFGPYHISRLNGAATYLTVEGIELSRADRIYDWNPTEDAFPREVVADDIETERTSRLIERISGILSARALDAVAIPGWGHRGALAALLWCTQSKTPAILMSESMWDDDVRSRWKEFVKRRIVSLCGSAVVGGKRHGEYLRALGMSPTRILFGYDVVDNDYFRDGAERSRRCAAEERQRLGLPENYFLASARFVEKKNLPRLLDAFAGYRQAAGRDAWDLVLLGDGHLRQQLIARISQRGLSDAVHLPGFRQYDDLPAYYGLAGAFVHASTVEQWGLVVNEAMAAGLPVIVSRYCGCADELVAPGTNGYTFDPLDPAELTRLLLHVASDRCDRELLAREGRAIVGEWSPHRFATALASAVEIAVRASRRVPVGDTLLLRALIHRRHGYY
jgi:1,2-diacylglycerol 3-alpha-glucosyltransferase